MIIIIGFALLIISIQLLLISIDNKLGKIIEHYEIGKKKHFKDPYTNERLK